MKGRAAAMQEPQPKAARLERITAEVEAASVG
jgi:hypothetical protein